MIAIDQENDRFIIEGSDGGIKNKDQAKEICKKIGYPGPSNRTNLMSMFFLLVMA